jgi:PAS domain S-box-containing protein
MPFFMENEAIKILAIDDIFDNLISIKALVMEAFPKAIVFMAQSGSKALELAQTEDPDLILLDVVMPGMDGFEICQRLKMHPSMREIPVVFVTALKGDRDSRIKALNVGAEAFLSKPIDEIELVAQIKAMVKIKKANLQKINENQRLAELVNLRTSELKQQLEERKIAEKKLVEQELQYHNLADSGQALIRASGVDKGSFYFNEPWLKFTGRKLDEEMGMGWYKSMHHEDIAAYTNGYHQAFEQKNPFELEFRLKNSVGVYRWIREHGSPNYDSQHNFMGYIGHCFDITDKRKVEERLNLQSLVLNQIQDCVTITDLNGVLIDINDSVVRLLGYSREELLGSTIHNYGENTAKGASQDDILGQTLANGCWKGEVANYTKDGRELILDVRTQMVFDQTQKPIALCGISTDITVKKEAEAMFKVLQQAVEQSPVSVVITDPAGTIEYVNPKFCQVTGYTSNEALGQNPRILKSGVQPARIYKEMWAKITSSQTWHGEFNNKKKSGELFWEAATISPILDEKGSICHFLAVKEDITDQKHTQLVQQTLYQIARTAILADSIGSFLEFVRQELSKLIDTTNFFVAIYNSVKDTLSTVHVKDEMDDFDEWPAGRSLTGKVVKDGVTIFLQQKEIETFLVSNNLEWVGTPSLSWVGVPILINKKVEGALVVQSYSNDAAYSASDIALLEMIAHETGLFMEKQRMIEDLIFAKEKAQESDSLKTAFINNISHEIRTPLNGIQGFGQLMTESDLTVEERLSYYNSVEESSSRLIQTVTDYMDMAMLASGNMPVNLSTIYLISEVADLTEKYRIKCEAKNLEFQLDFHNIADDFVVVFDKEILSKVLGHLLSNSIKFTSKGSVRLSCSISANLLIISVKDTGKGIGKEKQQKVFDAFIQEDLSTTRGHEGSGLGLAIVKRITELLNGNIQVESEKGEGAEFRLFFPIQIPNPSAHGQVLIPPKPRLVYDTEPVILVAEDDEDNYYYIQVLLNRMGYKYLRVDNGEDAVLQSLNNPAISLVLMDIKMPVLNGIEATIQIKAQLPDLPVIAITAYAQTGDEFRIIEAGCNDYIAKPIQKKELQTKILKHLSFVRPNE